MKFAKLVLVAACAFSVQGRSHSHDDAFASRYEDDMEFLEMEEPNTEAYPESQLLDELAQTHAEINAAPVNPFQLLQQHQATIPVKAAPGTKGGGSVTVHVDDKKPNPMAALMLLGNRQLYIPGLVRVMRSIHAGLLVTHGPFLKNDIAESSPAMRNEFQSVCEAETKDVLPAHFCQKMTKLYEAPSFKGLDIFSPVTMPVYIAAVAESIPTQYSPNVPLADAYLKVKEFVDDKPIPLTTKTASASEISEMDSRCSNEFEFAIKNGDLCHTVLAVYDRFFGDYDKRLSAEVAKLDAKKPKWAAQMSSMLAQGADHWLIEHMQEAMKGQELPDVAFTSAILLAIHVNKMDTSPPIPVHLPCNHPSAVQGSCTTGYHPCGAALAPAPCLPAPCGHPLAPAPCTPCHDHLLGCHKRYGTAYYDYDDKNAYNLYAMTHNYKKEAHAFTKNGVHYDVHGRPIKPKPTAKPTNKPTRKPSPKPTLAQTPKPTTPRPSSKPTTNPTRYPTNKPTSKPTSKPTTHHESAKAMCASFKQGCPCGHPLAPALPTTCTPCELHPLGCPCGHPAAAAHCMPCHQHVLGCGAPATTQVPCACAHVKLAQGAICPCSTQVVSQCMPPVGSTAHTHLMAAAHAEAKKAAAAVMAKGGTQTEANAAAAAAHAHHIATHAAAAAMAHAAAHAAVHVAAHKATTEAHIAAHLAAHPHGSVAKHISGINHFDTAVDSVTPCLVSPPLCRHGKCVDKAAKHYVCICDHGWAGDNCHIPLSEAKFGKVTQLAFALPFFSFNVPFSTISNDKMDTTVFESQIKLDLAKALKTSTDRFHVKGLSPSHDNKYTVVTMTVTPPVKKGDLTEDQISEKMRAMMFPKLAPALAEGIATRHLFTPGSGLPHFKSKRHAEGVKQLQQHLASKGKGVKLPATKNAAPAIGGLLLAVALPLVLSLSFC